MELFLSTFYFYLRGTDIFISKLLVQIIHIHTQKAFEQAGAQSTHEAPYTKCAPTYNQQIYA